MTLEEIKLRRLAGQHLLDPADIQTVVKDFCWEYQSLKCWLVFMWLGKASRLDKFRFI